MTGTTAMAQVYVILFERQLPSGNDEEKILGVYSTQAKADDAMRQIRCRPDFKDFPDSCFDAGPVTLDQTSWQEGFVDVAYEEM